MMSTENYAQDQSRFAGYHHGKSMITSNTTPGSSSCESPKHHQQLLQEMKSDVYSPTTITLRSSAETMFCSGNLMMEQRHQARAPTTSAANVIAPGGEAVFRQSVGSSRQTAAVASQQQPQHPYFPSLQISPPLSRPIRIARRKQAYSTTDHRPQDAGLVQDNTNTDHLSASPGELQHFYDEATWRMYHLIQASRLEKQEAAAAAAARLLASAPKNGGDGMDFVSKDDFSFVGLPPRSTLGHSNYDNQIPIVAPDYDDDQDGESEGVFELDDL